jgi:hypothetical protein
VTEEKQEQKKQELQKGSAEAKDPQIKDERGDFAGPKEPVKGLEPHSGQLMAHGTDLPTVQPLDYRRLGREPHTGQLTMPASTAALLEREVEFSVTPEPQSYSVIIRMGLKDPQRVEIMRALALIMNNHDRPREAQDLLNTGVNWGNPGEWAGPKP